MKKLKYMLALFFVISFGFLMSSCSLAKYNLEFDGVNYYGYSKTFLSCFYCGFDYDLKSDADTNFVIPDEYNKAKIYEIGGVINGIDYGMYPRISNKAINYNVINVYFEEYDEESLKLKDIANKVIVFTLQIGENINKVNTFRNPVVIEKNSKTNTATKYTFEYVIECSSENKSFYSKDGVLYNKNNDEVVEGIPYKK